MPLHRSAATTRTRRSIAASALALAVLLGQTDAIGQNYSLVSGVPGGNFGNGASIGPTVDAAGDTIAFETIASNLLRTDADAISDILLAEGGTLVIASARGATKGNRASVHASIDDAGTRLVFESQATNLAPPRTDANGSSDIFLRDATGAAGPVLFLLSQSDGDATAADAASSRPAISADGTTVVFDSAASDLDADQGIAKRQRIFVRDLTRTLDRGNAFEVPPIGAGREPNGDSSAPRVSGDGKLVAFQSTVSSFVAGDTNGASDIYLYRRGTGVVERVSVGLRGAEGNGASTNVRISDDGRWVGFDSDASNLVAADTNGIGDVFVRDLVAGTTERVSVDSDGGEISATRAARTISLRDISADGRFVAFATDIAVDAIDTNGAFDVYIRDRVLGTTTPLARIPGGIGDAATTDASLNRDGTSAALASAAENLAGPTGGVRQIFQVDLVPGAAAIEPPMDGIVFADASALRQLSPDGDVTDNSFAIPAGTEAAFAVEESNVLWVALSQGTVQRLRASDLSLVDRAPLATFPLNTLHHLAASRGVAWVAHDGAVTRVTATGVDGRLQLRTTPARATLALDPFGSLWFGTDHTTTFALRKLTRTLSVQHVFTFRIGGEFAEQVDQIAAGPRGDLFARSSAELVRLSRAGGIVWRRAIRGDGLAIDGVGNSFVISGDDIVGFDPAGARFLRRAHGGSLDRTGHLMFDGRGRVHALLEGGTAISRIDPAAERLDVRLAVPRVLADQLHGDGSGFPAASVSARRFDSDGDGILNGAETNAVFSPFDPLDPPPAERLPPVLAFDARAAGDTIELRWTSPIAFRQLYILRNGRQLRGSPFPFDENPSGFRDTGVPGGTHTYRVIGQGVTDGGAGGIEFDEDEIEEPFSLPSESQVSIGEGAIEDETPLDIAPDAVAFREATGEIIVALSGGELLFFDGNLDLADAALLPDDPFAATQVRGLAVDPADSNRLFLLLADGRIFARLGAADPAPFIDLPEPPDPAGYSGLAIRDDLFFALGGPGVECLIGFRIEDGAPDVDESLSANLGMLIDHSIGVARFPVDNTLLVGVGAPGTTTITEIRKLDTDFGDGGATTPLGGLGSDDIADFAYIPGGSVAVIDRSAKRLVVVDSGLPAAPRITSIDPSSGPWDEEQSVVITVDNLGAAVSDVWVGFDDVEVEIQDFDAGAGTVTVLAPQIDTQREIDVRVENSLGFDIAPIGYIYGFDRGDVNNDRSFDISDAIAGLLYLFGDGTEPPCRDAADADDSGEIDIADSVYILEFIFEDGPPPLPPSSPVSFGVDPTADDEVCGLE